MVCTIMAEVGNTLDVEALPGGLLDAAAKMTVILLCLFQLHNIMKCRCKHSSMQWRTEKKSGVKRARRLKKMKVSSLQKFGPAAEAVGPFRKR